MKHLRFALTVVVLALTSVAFAQHDAQKPSADAVPTAAQKSFTTIKTLAGEWEGPVTVPEMPEMSGGKPMHISLRVTSRGNVLVHEMQEAGTPLDATKYDHPVTMLYVDGDQLTWFTTVTPETGLAWLARCRPTARRSSSSSRTSAGARRTTCIIRCSPSSMPTITPRIGHS